MLKLFNIRYLQRKKLHSQIINNLIWASIKTSKERVVDILRSIPLAEPSNFYERREDLKIYPSSEEEYHKMKTDGIVISDRIVANIFPDGCKPLESMIKPKHYELFDVPESLENRLLFLNGYLVNYFADGLKYVQRVHFMYKKDGM
ncbi:hypothetical protein RF11_13442 [Thelohanellus kitauei]|uniref:Uncharacterized protein n=1 Tax=Thelohanellus kitauei TaxID=669202 RepID=A0A0C2ND25_THEKT|nr:hypothetical protein RF11_13442 [Thelohanellus kitauei]